MANIVLPYTLQEGTKAYAAKVMADFNAILGVLNNVDLDGLSSSDLSTILQTIYDLASAAVVASETSNASQIRFSDGVTLQAKFDSGDLHGADAVALQLNGMYYFDVDDYGHLILYAPDDAEQPPFTIDETGHLKYTLADPETEGTNVTAYDLGLVKGGKGDAGDMDASVYDTTGKAEDIFTYTDTKVAAATKSAAKAGTINAAAWSDGVAAVTLAEVTASNNFIVSPAYSATDAEDKAWRDAQIRVISQGSGTFSVQAYGDTPAVDIPITVVILP